MTIEIHTPGKLVDEAFIKLLKTRLLDLYHLQPKISRAEVFLQRLNNIKDRNARCEIRLSIIKDNIMVSRNSVSFEKATNAVLKQLNALLSKQTEPTSKLPGDVNVQGEKV